MSKYIEEFYYGNIDPQARSTKQNKTVQKQMEQHQCHVLNQRSILNELRMKQSTLPFCAVE